LRRLLIVASVVLVVIVCLVWVHEALFGKESLPAGARLAREMSAHGTHVFVFEADAGSYHEMSIRQAGIDVMVIVTEPGGHQVTVDNLFGDYHRELVCLLVRRPGTVAVEIRNSSDRRGSFEIIRNTSKAPSAVQQARDRVFRRETTGRNELEFWQDQAERWRQTGVADFEIHAYLKLADAANDKEGIDPRDHTARLNAGRNALQRARTLASRYRNTESGHPDSRLVHALVLHISGYLHFELNDFGEAERAFEEASRLRRTRPQLRASSLYGLARAQIAMSYRTEALTHLKEARIIFAEHGNIDRDLACLSQLMWICFLEDMTVDLGGYHRKAKGLLDRVGDPSARVLYHNVQGKIFTGQGAYDEALQHFDQARAELGEGHPSLEIIVANAMEARIENDPERAIAFYQSELGQFTSKRDRAHLHYCLARARYRFKDLAGARQELETSLALLEEVSAGQEDFDRRIAYVSDRYTYAGLMATIILELEGSEAALLFSESYRARELQKAMVGARDTENPLPSVRRALGDDGLLIYFMTTPTSIIRWTMSQRSGLTHSVFSQEARDALADDFVNLLHDMGDGTPGEAMGTMLPYLERTLLQGISHRGYETIYLCLDGMLGSIPFSLLFEARDAFPTLIEIPSLSVGLALAQRSRCEASAPPVIVAAPAYGHDAEPLEGSNLEADYLAEVLAIDETRIFRGREATPESLFSEQVRKACLLHIACHGRTNSRLSGLSLSASGGDRPARADVFVSEIAENRFAADLLILSACGTGVGPVYGGEGPLDLSHGFFRAGVGAQVVSLFSSDDVQTAELMKVFYEKMVWADLPPGDALAETRRDMRAMGQNPLIRGAFVFRGGFRRAD